MILEMSVGEIEDVLIKKVMKIFVKQRIYSKTRRGRNRINAILSRSYDKIDYMNTDEKHLMFSFHHRLARSLVVVSSNYHKNL